MTPGETRERAAWRIAGHSSLLIAHRRRRVMIDCGEDWREGLRRIAPDAIVPTHAHPDHAFRLKSGADRPVYATEQTWRQIERFAIPRRAIVRGDEHAIGLQSQRAWP